jgi:DNA-binding transcriptional LysR family regulator
MDLSTVGLRVLREVAERGSFTGAATALGYTQSAVSRQIAALEQLTGAALFERRSSGARLTTAGGVLLRHAVVVLAELDAVGRELDGLPAEAGSVRLGAFAAAGAVLLPRALAALRRSHPHLEVTTREGPTPSLVRALRAGTLDLAVLALSPPFRAPDAETPALLLETLSEGALHVAVPTGSALGTEGSVRLADLRGQRWIVSRSGRGEALLGAWPGLDERPLIGHVAQDWLTKLQLVAAGCGLTTVPHVLAAAAPPGVRILTVVDGPTETRRLVLARLPGPRPTHLEQALRNAVA